MALCFEDVEIGTTLCSVTKGPMSPAHIMRWSAAMENWHRIHYDQPFATGHDKLPDILINGSWKQHVLVQVMKDGLGPDGWLWKISFRYKSMDVVWDKLTAVAEVLDKREADGLGFVRCGVQLINQHGKATTDGIAIGVLPLKGGRPVPSPFQPKDEHHVFALAE